jgi:hypothetical protein
MQNVIVNTLQRLVDTRKFYKDFYSKFGELISVQNFERIRGIWFPVIMQNDFGGKVFFFKLFFIYIVYYLLWCKPKTFKICICCFSTKHAALRRKSKDGLTQNQDNVS